MPKRPQRPIVRLHAIVARKADVAVVFRRGPSKLVQVLKWNLLTDEIEPGQWLKGQIMSGDLTPDGKKMVYYVFKRGSSWIAVSHPPYLTALALWPSSSWIYGYGEFLNNQDLVLPDDARKLHPKFVAMMKHPRAVKVVRARALGENCKNANGWRVDTTKKIYNDDADTPKGWGWFVGKLLGSSESRYPVSWRKRQPVGHHELVNTDTSKGSSYRVLTGSDMVRCDLGLVDWADWDHRGQLLYAAKGCLWRVADVADAKSEPKLVADLNANKFTEVVAPDWAKQW